MSRSGPYMGLYGPERRAFLSLAGGCFGVGLAVAAVGWAASAYGGDWQFAIGWAGLMTVIAAYYARVAYGWVYVDAGGLRTSRWLRGRRFRWDEIESIEPKTWYGKGGSVTVAKVRTRSGHSYYLPVPRSTSGAAEPGFRRQLSRLQQNVRSR